MPYRRLPNTDTSRIKAMKIALEKGKEIPPHKLAYSARNIVRLRHIMPLFEHNIQLQRQTQMSHNKRSKKYYEVQHKAKMYLTHFIRVMNMAILRGEHSKSIRTSYGLDAEDCNVPVLNSEKDLINWGKKIIEGEEKRVLKGGSPVTNPSIAVVKVWYEKFIEKHNYHNTLQIRSMDYSEKIIEMRKEVDEIVLDIWNEVEEKFRELPDQKRKKECEKYGLIYFYRKGELERIMENNNREPDNWS